MRIPSFLVRAPSGVWHFRQRVPADVVPMVGSAAIKRSLGTRELLAAQLRALALAQRYAWAFQLLRRQAVAKGKPSVEDILAAAHRDYRLIRGADGSIEIEANGVEDHRRAMDAVERIGLLSREPAFQGVLAAAAQPPAPASDSKIPTVAIGKAVAMWLTEIEPTTKRKTFSIKTAAVEGFAKHYGEKNALADAGRLDVGQWVQALRAGGLQTPTIVNKCSYLRGFFDWAKARGYYPPFGKDENPAAGQIVYGTREKRARRAFGFKPFSDDQIRVLFHADTLTHLSEGARWGALLGLYTGARVSEVGQLQLSDVIEVDGIACLSITDEGEGQSVKTEVSRRIIPIHPDLLALGLLDRVELLRKEDAGRLFPKAKSSAVNGPGQWLSKAFSVYIQGRVTPPAKGKLGFHSLRKTVIQTLQGHGVAAELRAAYVGHELDDEHHATYSRKPTAKELFAEVEKLGWGLDLSAIKRILSQGQRKTGRRR